LMKEMTARCSNCSGNNKNLSPQITILIKKRR
jgi:hypothetical protein